MDAGLDEFRWFGSDWQVQSELPGVAAFAAASQAITRDMVAEQIPCGPNVGEHVEKLRTFVEAGFTHVAIVQIGGDRQDDFLRWAKDELLPELRNLS
jgi:hypothetical protein